MTEPVDVYWSFRSPYSYVATPDMLALGRDYDVSVHLRVVLPIAVRAEKFFDAGNRKWGSYILMDWVRRAEFLGMPHAWPDPDPIVQNLNTREISIDQPYIFWLSALGVEAERRGKGPEFSAEVSKLIFGGTQNWHQDGHLTQAASRAGLQLVEMLAEIENGTHREEIERNQITLDESGHWGVPTFVFRGEPFFGQDRVELLRWTLDKHGVARRSAK